MRALPATLLFLLVFGARFGLLRACENSAQREPAKATAEKLGQLHKSKQWPEAQKLVDRLLSADRAHAAQVFALVLRDRQIETRSHIISDIERLGLKEAVPTLIELLDDPDAGVRSWSAIALGALGDRSAVDALERRVREESEPGVRYRTRVALARLGRPYLQYFISGLTDRNVRRRYWCICALGTLKDKRALPHLVELLGSVNTSETDTWEPMHATRAITKITGIENIVITKTVNRPDGSTSSQGRHRPRHEFEADCLAWIEKYRDEVSQAVEESLEPWKYTPEPHLPGLNVAFTMDARQVVQVYRDAGLDCRHSPQRRWEKGGTEFFQREEVTASKSCLGPLNERLASIRYIFEDGRLHGIYAELLLSPGGSPLEPLKRPLELRKGDRGAWTGLDGSIIVQPRFGDAETETYGIGLNLSRETW